MGCLHSNQKDTLKNIETMKLLEDGNHDGQHVKKSKKLTIQRHSYNKKEKFLNWCCGVVLGMGLDISSLEIESILDAATYRTGCDDFGGNEFVPRLTKLLQCGAEAPITNLARIMFREAMIGKAAALLKMQAYISAHPEIPSIPIVKPIFVVGLPRTGTTLLQNLLSLNGDMRPLKFWEMTTPTPVSDDREEDVNTRRNHAARLLRMAYFMSPEMADVHELTADTPEECWHLFATSFAILNMDLSSGLTNYGEWLVQQNMDQPYMQFRRSLQVMASQTPTKHFCLKCPEHLWFLDSLMKAFPDASIIWTHRDPVQSIASYCSLVSLSRRTFYGNYDPKELGAHIASRFDEGISRAIKVDESKEYANRVHHVNFEDLVGDPAGVVRNICNRFDYNVSENLELLVDNYLNNQRSDKKGKHVYDADLYGLDSKELHHKMSAYIEKYNVKVKTPVDKPSSKVPEQRQEYTRYKENANQMPLMTCSL